MARATIRSRIAAVELAFPTGMIQPPADHLRHFVNCGQSLFFFFSFSHLPEPNDLRCLGRAVFESRILLPVVHINIAYSTDDQLQLALVKRPQKLIRYQFTEALNKAKIEVKAVCRNLINSHLSEAPKIVAQFPA